MKYPADIYKRAVTFYKRNHRRWLAGEFSPLRIGLQPPTAAKVAAAGADEVRAWLAAWEGHWLEPETTPKRLDVYGTHTVPTAVVLDGPEVAARAAGMLPQWQRINELLERFVEAFDGGVRTGTLSKSRTGSSAFECTGTPTGARDALIPRLGSWQDFEDTTAQQFIGAVTWIRGHETSHFYIRELPIKGIDSKWLARHRSLIESLTGPLDFKEAPALIDMRSLDPAFDLFGLRRVVCERADARAATLPGTQVIIVENYQTYLALPEMPGTVAIYGQGLNAVSLTRNAAGLQQKDVVYWGDLDSNGFYILDHVRRNLPHARSVMMDVDTARAHAEFGVEETTSKRFTPENLTVNEIATLEFLHTHADNTWLRIEQERIGFDWVCAQLRQIRE